MRLRVLCLLSLGLGASISSRITPARESLLRGTRLMSSGRVLVDFDANLCHAALKDSPSIDHHMTQGRDHAHISHFVVPGATLSESAECLRLSEEKGSSIIATAGVHPYHVGDEGGLLTEANQEVLKSLLSQESCQAVGETGLDYAEGFPDKELQLPWFEAQVALAMEMEMPLFLHVREARNDFVDVMLKLGFPATGPPPVNSCVHCFTGETDELQQYVDMGFYIGLTGYILDKGKDQLPKWLRIIPEDRLVLETDAPYLGWKGCRATEAKKKTAKFPNVPAALTTICEAVAEAKGASYEDVATSTTANALRFFGAD